MLIEVSSLSASLVAQLAEAKLSQGTHSAHVVHLRVDGGLTGWPIVALLDVGGQPVELARYDQLPLADQSVESMATVIADLVRALRDEYFDAVDPNRGAD